MKNKIQCLVCGEYYSQVNNFHLKTHGTTPKKYLDKYPNANLFSQALRNKINERENYRDWTEEEDKYLFDNCGKIPITRIAKNLNRSDGSVYSRKRELEKRGFKFKKFCVDCKKDISNRVNSSRCQACAKVRLKKIKQINRAKERKVRYCIDCGKDLWLTRMQNRCKKCAERHRQSYNKEYHEKRYEIQKGRENLRRKKEGVPLVGEGNISEAMMKNLLDKIFNDEKCIDNRNYKKLDFLELDRYYPNLGVAFEYQGEQHFKPVQWTSDISDGEAEIAFKRQKERDGVKRKLCKKNGIILIEISYNEKLSTETIVQKIEETKNKPCLKRVKKFNKAIRKELDNEEIKKLWDKGYSIVGISRILNWSYSSIRDRLEKMGLKPEYRKFTNEELKNELAKGLSQKEIAKNLGVNQRAIYERMRRLRLKPNFPRKEELIKITDEQLIKELRAGLSQEQIAKKYKMSTTAIRERRKKLGLPTNFPTNEERRKFTDEELIREVKKGETINEIMKKFNVKRRTVQKRIKKLNLNVKSSKKEHTKYTKEQLLKILKDIYRYEGRVPTTKVLDSSSNYPSHSVYNKYFVSFTNALIQAGFKVRKKDYSKDEALDLLKELSKKLGKVPACRDLKNNKNLPSFYYYRKTFGSWNKALKEAFLL